MAGISKKKVKTKKGETIKYTITYRDIFGRQHTSGSYRTKQEAKTALKTFDLEKADCSKITYGQIFNDFLNKVKKKNTDGTYKNYKSYYDKHFKQFKEIPYNKVDSMYWQGFFDELEINHGPYVAQHSLKMAKAAVNRYVKHDKITKNIFNKIEKIKLPKPDINHCLINELFMILDECEISYPQYYALLYTLIGTGAREGEIFALTKEDYNRIELSIKINKQFTRNKLYHHPKTASSNRDITIFEDLAKVLDEHIKTLEPNNPLLFPNLAGNYINASNFRERFWKKLLKLCGINKRVRIHDLRGSYINMNYTGGVSPKFTQNNVGHARCETTNNIYARNNEDMINQAKTRINEIFIARKCEQNVSQKEKNTNCKIVQFPKKQATQG